MLRILHTSDWHLGHTLHDLSRRYEHGQFLRWLLDQLFEHRVDALLIAGDVFDTANPSADAQEMFYDFLAKARIRCPEIDIVVIGGNHDSAARLDAPDPVLRALGIRVVGGLPRTDGRIDVERVIVPLHDREGAIAAWVAAVPFLRAFDLPNVDIGDRLIEGVRRVYGEVIEALRARCKPSQALIAMGHCYMTGGDLSMLSERKILGGNQHALPIDIFPDDIVYVALGHLHRAQMVGGRDNIRYSGSPIPLSLPEAPYCHQINLVDLDGPTMREVHSLRIPRAVEIIKVPANGPRPLEEILPLLVELPPLDPAVPGETRPYLEVEVVVPKPEPSLRRSIEQAVQGKSPRLVRIGVQLVGSGLPLADAYTSASLKQLQAEDVFRQCYFKTYRDEPLPYVLEAFHELLEQVEAEQV